MNPEQSNTLTGLFILVGVIAGAFLILGFILSRLYRKATKEVSFVRTGLGGQKVIMNGGAPVLPVFQDLIRVNMNTLRLEVARRAESGLITKDRMRVDVQAEFFVRVKPTNEAIADAAQTLGQRTMDPGLLKELVEGKFVDALRAVAAEMTMEDLHEQRVQFVQRVQTTVSEDILKNGLELESVALTSLDQTSMEFLNPNNAFDAQGLAKLTETIEAKRKQRNDIEQETRVLIERKNLDAQQQSLQIGREQAYARMEQEREVAVRQAIQSADIAREQAARKQDSEQANIAAQQQVQQSQIVSERQIQEDKIAMERGLRELDVVKQRSIEAAEIEKKKQLELAEQDRRIAVAERSRALSEADALAANARAEAVRAEENVITVREREGAERRKAIELVLASEEAERSAIKIQIAAQADRKASEDRAVSLQVTTEAEAQAVLTRADASARANEVAAAGERSMNEARNLVSPAVLDAQVRRILIEHLPEIIRESVKPMERIEGIKIVQVSGMGGENGSSGTTEGGSNGHGGSLADQVVSSALRYRAQAPLLDSLLREVGLSGAALNQLPVALGEGNPPTNGVVSNPSSLPPAP